MWSNPHIDEAKEFAKKIGCDWIGGVKVEAIPSYEKNDCHNNVRIQTSIYGGKKVIGYYFLSGFGTYQAIQHSVWDNDGYIDITPYPDHYIIFGRKKEQVLGKNNYYSCSLDKYNQENEVMYYVYQIVDPRTNQPFYVGKGTGTRAQQHLWDISREHNKYKDNKIAAIRAEGLEPRIEFIAEDIVDETLAYNIEEELIKKYGRKGYEPDGILTNVCENNRPPNHKGKTYEEIYGPERAEEQRAKRHKLQLEAGGWFKGRNHSEETKNKFREMNSGENNAMWGKHHSDEAKRKIGEKAKLKVGKLNKNSKKYTLTSPEGGEHILYGGELRDFCKENDLSLSTLKKQIQKKDPWGIPRKGKTKGWKLKT